MVSAYDGFYFALQFLRDRPTQSRSHIPACCVNVSSLMQLLILLHQNRISAISIMSDLSKQTNIIIILASDFIEIPINKKKHDS